MYTLKYSHVVYSSFQKKEQEKKMKIMSKCKLRRFRRAHVVTITWTWDLIDSFGTLS